LFDGPIVAAVIPGLTWSHKTNLLGTAGAIIAAGAVVAQKFWAALPPLALSPPSPFSPLSETEKILYRPTGYICNLSLVGLPTL